MVLTINRLYNFGKEVTFCIQVVIIATSNTPLNIAIQHIYQIQTFRRCYRPRQDVYTNNYSIKTFVERKHKEHKIT